MPATDADLREWLAGRCREVIAACRVEAIDGTVLFTPDGSGHYGAMWLRDFAYLVEHGGEFLEPREVRGAIEVLLAGQRSDGAMPDRVKRTLVPIYQPGGEPAGLGHGPALDNPMFAVSLVYHYHRQFDDAELVRRAIPVLEQGMEWVPRNRHLIFNDPQRPSSTYGFQDTVAKSGHDLFCSLLWIIACRQMHEMQMAKPPPAVRAKAQPGAAVLHAHWLKRADEAQQSLRLLWDESQGAYLAANEACRQIDVWGNAFAVAQEIGDEQKRLRAAQWLAENYNSCVYRGQVRHLPVPQTWQRLFGDVPAGTYQNGGYWGTAAGWMLAALRRAEPELARRLIDDLLQDFRDNGLREWISPEGSCGPDQYVATAVNAWSIGKHSVSEEI